MARVRKLTALATIEKVIRKASKKAAKKAAKRYKRKIVALKAENRRLKACLKLLPEANDEEEVEEEEDELGWHGLTADAAATAGVDLVALNQATEVFINQNVNAALAPTIWACASPEVLQGTQGSVVLDIDPVTKKPRGYQNGKHFTEFCLEDLVEYTGKEPSNHLRREPQNRLWNKINHARRTEKKWADRAAGISVAYPPMPKESTFKNLADQAEAAAWTSILAGRATWLTRYTIATTASTSHQATQT